MSDDVKHPEDDLFSEDDVSKKGTDGDDVSTDGKDTPKGDELSSLLDEEPPKSEVAKKGFIEALARKVRSGEKTLDEIKASDQAWLVPDVEKLLDTKPPKPTSNSVNKEELAEMARQEARKILEEERKEDALKAEDNAFNQIKKQIKDVARTPEQNKLFKEEYEDLKRQGLPRSVAAKKAAKYARIDFEKDIDERKKEVETPKMGGGAPKDDQVDLEQVDPNSLDSEQRYKEVLKRKKMGGMV